MNLKPLICSVALAAMAATASAAPVNLGVLDASGLNFSRTFGRLFGLGSLVGDFTDEYTFDLVASTGVAGTSGVTNLGSTLLVLKQISLTGGTLGKTVVDDFSPEAFRFDGLGAGTYTMTLAGNLGDTGAGGTSSYSGRIDLADSTVPEPGALGLSLLAMGAAAGISRRRSLSVALVPTPVPAT